MMENMTFCWWWAAQHREHTFSAAKLYNLFIPVLAGFMALYLTARRNDSAYTWHAC